MDSATDALTAYLRAEVARIAGVTEARVDLERPLSALGFDSLMAVELRHRVEIDLGVDLPLASLLEGPSPAEVAAEVRHARDGAPARAAARAAIEDGEPFPLTLGQQALWLLHHAAVGGTPYHLAAAAQVSGPLDPLLLRHHVELLAAHHPGLRTTFAAPDGVPVQRVRPGLAPTFEVIEAAGWDEQDLDSCLAAAAHRPFDLEQGPLLRLTLFRRGPGEHVLLVVLHHLVVDLWSVGVLMRDLAAVCTGGELPPPARSYRDYVEEQRARLAGPRGEALWAYWTSELAGPRPALDLPTDRPRPAQRSWRGSLRLQRLDAGLAAGVRALGAAHRATLFSTLLAAFQTLLHRYSGQAEVLVGAPTAGREDGVFAEVVGYFVNPVVLRADFSDEPRFAALLARLRGVTLGALAHQELPFALLAERLQVERHAGRPPIFQVMFALQRAHLPGQEGLAALALGMEGGRLELGGFELAAIPLTDRRTEFDLHLTAVETAGGIMLSLLSDADLFDPATAVRMLGHLETVLRAVVAEPERPVADLALLTAAESGQLLEWNATGRSYPGPHCLHRLCEAQADRTPDAIAVVAEEGALTYRGLDRKANRLARHLRAEGVGPEAAVAICAERSLDLVIGLLGILKAGALYVPLDPSYPRQRLAFLLEDSGAAALLIQERFAYLLPAPERRPTIRIDADRPAIARRSAARLADAVDPDRLCYVLYTSGSTGRPKGAMNTHRAIVNRLLWMQETYGLSAADRVLQKTPFSFDVSIPEMFAPLLVGARLVMARPGGHQDAAYLDAVIAREGITAVHFVPPMLRIFLAVPDLAARVTLRRVVCSGEALPPELVQELFSCLPGVELLNLYGPTEAAVEVTAWRCEPRAGLAAVPIGRPIANLRAHLVDRRLQPVPVGAPGELLIGGMGPARGYLGRPDLTAEKLIPDPLAVEEGARCYRTGDLARRRPGGEVEYLGRLDHQVKIRGVRIELGEIETALLAHPAVRGAVVGARRLGEGSAGLVAYVVPKGETAPAREDLREHLRLSLPEPMIPAAFVVLEELPLSPNGKVDRRALPEPEALRRATAARPSRSPFEELVAGLFAEVLGVGEVGVTDGFFDLGGHSLLVGRVVARLRAATGIDLGVRAVFDHPTPAALARLLAAGVTDAAPLSEPPLRRLPRDRPLPLSSLQERLWLLSRLTSAPVYHELLALRLAGPLDTATLRRSLAEIVRRHEVLRTAFPAVDGVPVGMPVALAPRPIRVDLSALPDPLAAAELVRFGRAFGRAPYDLEAGPLLRAALVERGGHEHVLVFALHHLVVDGWSWWVLLRELTALYSAFSAGRPSPLPDLAIQYADFAAWQRERLDGAELTAQLAYWRERLRGLPGLLELPADRLRPAAQSFRGRCEPVLLPTALLAGLHAAARRQDATLFMLATAAFLTLLNRLTGSHDVAVGSPIANRERSEAEGLIGPLLNTLVLRLDLAGDPEVGELLRRTREMALGAYTHRDLPVERLVDELRPERDLGHSPLVQVMLVHHGDLGAPPSIPGIGLELLALELGIAKFDLTLGLRERPEGLEARFDYATDLFDRATVARWAGALYSLLAAAAASPHARLSELPLLTPPERQQLLVEWNDTAGAAEATASVPDLVAEQARQRPTELAVDAPGARLDYAELAARAGRLAGLLTGLGVGPEVRVGLCARRPEARVVGALAILWAGGAYLPLDRAWPAGRVRALLADAGAPVLLADGDDAADWAPEGARLVRLDVPLEDAEEPAAPALPPRPAPESAAYVIYTSGSTGGPKAVVVPHAGLANLVAWHRRRYGVGPGDRATLLAGPGFDAAVWEIWPYLASGASLHAPEPDLRTSAPHLARWLVSQRITLAFLTTPLAEAVLREDWPAAVALRALLTGGDRLTGRPRADLPFRLVNHYGPTEASVVATSAVVEPGGFSGAPSIGRPIANLRAHLLDRSGGPVSAGAPGELCVAGAGLARGYLGRPESTADRFVPDPFGAPGGRLYRSGDLARHRPLDGALEFLGRLDHQVKVRGVRIEPGEVEAVLRRHPDVAEAVVALRPGPGGDPALVAWVVPAAGAAPAPAALREHLLRSLPEVMVPAVFGALAALPLTANGKIDRNALPVPVWGAGESGKEEAPRTPLEDLVAGLWADLFGRERVGVGESFFDLGGHSLLASRLVARIRTALGVELPLRDLFEEPTVAGLARRIGGLLEAERRTVLPPLGRAHRRPTQLPLSSPQRRLWFFAQLEPGSALYNVPIAARLAGRLAPEVLTAALVEVVRRHEALRTVFPSVAGRPVQVVLPPAVPALPRVDLAALPEERREAEALALAGEEARRPFDLTGGPLMRAGLLRLAEEEHLFLFNLHHIVADGWSIEVLARDLSALVAAYASGRPSPLPELPVQFADYALWQSGWLEDDAVLRPALAAWEERLSGMPWTLELPCDRSRPPVPSFRGAKRPLAVAALTAGALRLLARRRMTTLFTILLAGFQVLLHRLSGQDALLLGAPVASRRAPEVEDLVGFFANTLVLGADLTGDPAFERFAALAHDELLAAYAYEDLPFERLVEHLQPARSLGRTPLFQVVFTFQRLSPAALDFPGISAAAVDLHTGTAKFDLTVVMAEEDGELRGWIEYASDLFDPATVARFAARFERLLAAIAETPQRRLSELPWLPQWELHQVVHGWNDTATGYPSERCVHDLFAEVVAAYPERVALACEDRELSYGELAARSSRLAWRLRGLGVGPEVLVAVCTRRSVETVVALLAVLEAGAAYVPLDPAYPQRRQELMLAESGAAVLLRQVGMGEGLSAAHAVLLGEGEEQGEAPAPAPASSADDLAYVMFTSGSTGRPKGVGVPHRGVVRLVRETNYARFGPREVFLQLAPTSFDASTLEIWGALLNGSRLVVSPAETPTLEELARTLERHQVTTLWLTAALFHQMVDAHPDSLRGVSQLLAGGDVLSPGHVRRAQERGAGTVLIDGYGPTENTTFSCCQRLHPGEPVGPSVPIGRPIANTRVYLLDGSLRPAAIGVVGEVLVGGAGLARGYLGSMERTAEAFVPDPLGAEPGGRLYRTGDRARTLADGRIEFLGRMDAQVKVRGFRVEPGEVEAALAEHAGVREAAVVARADGTAGRRLVAYVVAAAEQGASAGELRAYLRDRLPEPMVPSAFVMLPALPVTPNGKLDRAALPAPDVSRPDDGGHPFVAPRTDAEQILARIWSEVLGVMPIGVHDDFFDLGGHSLAATRVMAELRASFGMELPLARLFQRPTIAGLATAIEEELLEEIAQMSDEEARRLA